MVKFMPGVGIPPDKLKMLGNSFNKVKLIFIVGGGLYTTFFIVKMSLSIY
jgi:hypothetical protein